MSSPLGIKARIRMICHGCKLEISETLLIVDLRIIDISEFDVILRTSRDLIGAFVCEFSLRD